jgi:hypothetical protein
MEMSPRHMPAIGAMADELTARALASAMGGVADRTVGAAVSKSPGTP